MTTILLLTMTATTAAQDNITDNTVNPELEKQYTTTSQINEYENSGNNSDNKIIKKEQTRREISLILPEGRKVLNKQNIRQDTIMHGKDRNKTIIYADNTNDSSILFDVGRGKKLTLTNLTLQGQQGILIRNYGTVILENVTVRNSRANIIENYGNITIRNSNFTSISSQHIITDKSSATGKNIEIINTEFNNCNVDKNTVFLDIKKSDLKVENVSFKNIDNIKNIITLRNTLNVLLDGVYMLKNTPSEGAIVAYYSNFTIRNSVFEENKAANSTIILHDGSNINIDNTRFIKNKQALMLNESVAYINNSQFISNFIKSEGGAIASINSNLTVNNSNFTNNTAEYGGAIVVVNGTADNTNQLIIKQQSNIYIANSNFNENMAKHMAGCIYDEYSDIQIINSNFTNNTATNGGVIYTDNVKLDINNTQFINNTAKNIAGVIYAYTSTITQQNTRYIKNSAKDATDMYIPFNINFTDINNTYTNNNSIQRKYITQITTDTNHYTYNTTILPAELPSYYNLADYGLITPTKNQLDGGNCWAFSTIGVLESNLLKTTGKVYDLSENNLKNLMYIYSKNGQYRNPNIDGSALSMGVGYIINWLGPVVDVDDIYNPHNYISTQLPNIMKVSNIYKLPQRMNATDNNAIKQAILKYGALGCSIMVDDSQLGHNFYVNNTTNINHLVMIVGWDDNYSRYNFKNTPAGDGAFIIKNSWGDSGANEFYYISYYDTSINCKSISQINTSDIWTFILDNNNFDKQYFYDISGCNFYSFNSKNITYSNEYEIQQNEQIQAFGTYIYNPTVKTNYTAQIYVDGKLKTTQKGVFSKNYYYQTIKLENPVDVKAGDVATIRLTLKSNEIVGVPVGIANNQHIISTNNSKIEDEICEGYVVSLKLYSNTKKTDMQVKTTGDHEVTIKITDKDFKEVNSGKITLKYNNKTLDVVDVKSDETKINLSGYDTPKITFYYTGYGDDSTNYTINMNIFKDTTKITLNITDTKINQTITIRGKLVNSENQAIKNANITIQIDNKIYTTTTDENGVYSLNYTSPKAGVRNVYVAYNGDENYQKSDIKSSFKVNKLNINFEIQEIKGVIGDTITIKAILRDENGNTFTGGNVAFKFNNVTLKEDGTFSRDVSPLKVSVENGIVTITLPATKEMRDAKNLTIAYSGSSYYNNATSQPICVEIAKRCADIHMNIIQNTTKNMTQAIITATINETTKKSENTMINTDDYVIIKVNGCTIKDKTGKPEKIKVENNKIQYVYKIPANTKNTQYKFDVIYSSPYYYPNMRDSEIITIKN